METQKEIDELEAQAQAIRYALDTIDDSWNALAETMTIGSVEYEKEHAEMETHRITMLEMQIRILKRKKALQ